MERLRVLLTPEAGHFNRVVGVHEPLFAPDHLDAAATFDFDSGNEEEHAESSIRT
jgi:hypothetical protein